MPDHSDDLGLPMNANGPAYTSSQARCGVPLHYVAGKLGNAIEELHRYGHQHPKARKDLMLAMYHLLGAYLGLHNMLGANTLNHLSPS